MSKQIAGVFIAIGGILIAQLGFSDSCSNEILAKVTPLLGAMPGLLTVYIARFAKGDVNIFGAKV